MSQLDVREGILSAHQAICAAKSRTEGQETILAMSLKDIVSLHLDIQSPQFLGRPDLVRLGLVESTAPGMAMHGNNISKFSPLNLDGKLGRGKGIPSYPPGFGVIGERTRNQRSKDDLRCVLHQYHNSR
jgi:hypothetical protein